MAFDQAGEGLLKRLLIQATGQAHRRWQIVCAALRIQMPEKPHALLSVRQRLPILGIDPGRNRKPGKIHPFPLQRIQEHLALFQGQPDKPASEFQGVFSIHFLSSGSVGRQHKGTSSL